MKDKRINVRVSNPDKAKLVEISRKLDIPQATIVRDAVKEKINELSRNIQTEKKIALNV